MNVIMTVTLENIVFLKKKKKYVVIATNISIEPVKSSVHRVTILFRESGKFTFPGPTTGVQF